MEHAARGVARIAGEMMRLSGISGGEVLCLCGPGNNGGDGYGAARFLRSWGQAVHVLRCAPSEPPPGDARVQFDILRETERVHDAWDRPELVREALERGPGLTLDALFGVGLARPLGDPYLSWVRTLNSSGGPVLALDVPSGMETDTGSGLPECTQALATATMVAPKLGFGANPQACGHIVEVDIGLPMALHGSYLAER